MIKDSSSKRVKTRKKYNSIFKVLGEKPANQEF